MLTYATKFTTLIDDWRRTYIPLQSRGILLHWPKSCSTTPADITVTSHEVSPVTLCSTIFWAHDNVNKKILLTDPWCEESIVDQRITLTIMARNAESVSMLWRHDMKKKKKKMRPRMMKFNTLQNMNLCDGNLSVIGGPVDFPHKGQVMQNFCVSFLVSRNKLLSKQSSCW